MVNKWIFSNYKFNWLFRSVQKVYSGWKPIKLQQVELRCQLTLIIFFWPTTLFFFLLISFMSINHPTPPLPLLQPIQLPISTVIPNINLQSNSPLPPSVVLHFSGSSGAHIIISSQASPFLSPPPHSISYSLAFPSCLPACLHLLG